MDTIKILIPLHTLPKIQSVTTMGLESIINSLKKKVKVQIIWLVYTPEKLKSLDNSNSNDVILDIHNYDDALDVIKKEKPDLIYAYASWNFIDYSFSSAAKKFNIPVFCILHAKDPFSTTKTTAKNIKSNFTRFFEMSVPTDQTDDKKILFKRGRFFLYKYLFLVKTQLKLKTSFDNILTIWKYVISDTNNSKFGNNIFQFLENSELFETQIQSGFKKSNLFITGNSMYDKLFKKFSENKIKHNEFTNVLFIPSTLYEHGFWTLKQRNFVLKEIATQINQNSTLNLSVKIHPSSSNFTDYSSVIHSINPSIQIFQKGSVEEFLHDVDVVISSQSSTAEVYALLANKRIVICDFFNSEYDDLFVKKGIAISCKNPSDIISSINKAKILPSYEENRKKFIDDFLFKWDGKSSERISNHLLEILENYKSNL